ncbi:hypothetical protein ASZ90_018936 [hydrocarbon metagenome]|uniref:Uncharacterized protein n=1 Tax=hydrocarbon metagenome TaxID=938273 RepID=A0A0W8E5D7_9ZZZZ
MEQYHNMRVLVQMKQTGAEFFVDLNYSFQVRGMDTLPRALVGSLEG